MLHRLLIALVVAVSILVNGHVAEASTASNYCLTSVERKELYWINRWRQTYGLPALIATKSLGAAARHHSIDMAVNDYFSHTLSDGTTWSQNIYRHGYTFGTYKGENLAAGNSDPYKTFLQWRYSPGHNANMLGSHYKAIGIAMKYDPDSTWGYYWTTTFGGVVDTPAQACS